MSAEQWKVTYCRMDDDVGINIITAKTTAPYSTTLANSIRAFLFNLALFANVARSITVCCCRANVALQMFTGSPAATQVRRALFSKHGWMRSR
jgi:hypothetical protein